MLGMATARAAGGMSHADFETAWGNQDNVNFLKDQFRAADPGKHEWIPSNMIRDVIARAHTTGDAEKAAAWVELHHKLRCDTSHLIYLPSYTVETTEIDGAHVHVLSGHSGALYLEDAGKSKPAPSTFKQGTWHDELRKAFSDSTSIVGCIDDLRARFKATIWNGTDALPDNVFKKYVDSTGKPIDWSTLAKDQADRFKDVDKVFLACRTQLEKFG